MSKTTELRETKDVMINGVSLDKILENHYHYLHHDHKDWKSMKKANLSGLDLKDINFNDANLAYIDFTDSDLSGSSFVGANCIYAVFANTILDNTVFRCVDGSYSCFMHSSFMHSKTEGYKADFSNSIFNNANFENAILDGKCNFSNTSLQLASFNHTYIENANFKKADLSDAIFTNVKLIRANFDDADLSFGYFSESSLPAASFKNANLKSAYFTKCNIQGANFKNALTNEYTIFEGNAHYHYKTIMPNTLMICPEEGSFIGYKIGAISEYSKKRFLIKLEILESAKRLNGDTRVCRCDKAKVLDIINIDTKEHVNMCSSCYDYDFKYEVGKVSEVNEFDDNRWVDYTTGIHFFMTKQEALDWVDETL